jgi:DNA-3-methyladenine glycosylase II
MGVTFPHPPAAARAVLDKLIASDPELAGIEIRAGPLPWRTRTPGFPGLLQAIVAQQISNQAAAAIWGRLRAIGGALQPAGLLALSDESLRAAGLSRPKIAHVRALAAAFLEGTLDPVAIAAMDDEAAVAAVRGLGRWTAEASAAHLRRLDARPGPAELRTLADGWRHARSLAARLLWHHWRHVTGRPALDDFPIA